MAGAECPADRWVLEMRKATADDVDDIANIQCAAFPADPQWPYRFPGYRTYPEDTLECTRYMYHAFLNDHGNENTFVKIITDRGLVERVGPPKPIAVAVWKLEYVLVPPIPGTKKPDPHHIFLGHRPLSPSHLKLSADNCKGRRDANWKHMQAFDEAIEDAKGMYFDSQYGSNQLHLLILGTHPDFQRHGAGTRLCRWGMNLAQERNLPLTLFSSPMGEVLYRELGFKMVGTVSVQVDDEEEKLTIGAMTYNAD